MLDAPPGPRGPAAAAAGRRRGGRARRRPRAADRGPAGARGAPLPEPWPRRGARPVGAAARRRARAARGVGDPRGDRCAAGSCPEWERIRLLPHASAIHRFTVDRHVVETCIEASRLIRRVARPDVLMVSALLHDIGKGGLTEHSVAGEPIAAVRRDPDGLRARRGRPDRHPGALAPAARGDRHHPRPRRPGHGRQRSPSGSPEALSTCWWC